MKKINLDFVTPTETKKTVRSVTDDSAIHIKNIEKHTEPDEYLNVCKWIIKSKVKMYWFNFKQFFRKKGKEIRVKDPVLLDSNFIIYIADGKDEFIKDFYQKIKKQDIAFNVLSLCDIKTDKHPNTFKDFISKYKTHMSESRLILIHGLNHKGERNGKNQINGSLVTVKDMEYLINNSDNSFYINKLDSDIQQLRKLALIFEKEYKRRDFVRTNLKKTVNISFKDLAYKQAPTTLFTLIALQKTVNRLHNSPHKKKRGFQNDFLDACIIGSAPRMHTVCVNDDNLIKLINKEYKKFPQMKRIIRMDKQINKIEEIKLNA